MLSSPHKMDCRLVDGNWEDSVGGYTANRGWLGVVSGLGARPWGLWRGLIGRGSHGAGIRKEIQPISRINTHSRAVALSRA